MDNSLEGMVIMIHFDFIAGEEEVEAIFDCIQERIEKLKETHASEHIGCFKGWFKNRIVFLENIISKMKNKEEKEKAMTPKQLVDTLKIEELSGKAIGFIIDLIAETDIKLINYSETEREVFWNDLQNYVGQIIRRR